MTKFGDPLPYPLPTALLMKRFVLILGKTLGYNPEITASDSEAVLKGRRKVKGRGVCFFGRLIKPIII